MEHYFYILQITNQHPQSTSPSPSNYFTLSSCSFLENWITISFINNNSAMACIKIDDLEDIAADLFDFGEDQPRTVRKEKTLKKQKKRKNPEAMV